MYVQYIVLDRIPPEEYNFGIVRICHNPIIYNKCMHGKPSECVWLIPGTFEDELL